MSMEKSEPAQESIKCPFCKKGDISITFVPGYMAWSVNRISAGSKRTKYFIEPKYTIHNKCSECKAMQKEIKEALERGTTKQISHEERLKRLKDAGLPTTIES